MKDEKPKHYFPMFVDLSDKKVVVAGAGTIAKRRIRSLISFTDHLVVIAPEVNAELLQLEEQGRLTIMKKYYEREDIYDASLVIAATNDKKINNEIYTACKCLGIPVNVCADKNKCDFYFPSLAMTDELVVAVSSAGQDTRKQRETTEAIRAMLG
jgi:siroheme synthase-like protein